jgi:hypothetical protein
MGVCMLNDKNKSIITKENLINIILEQCNEDFISTDDLIKLIDKTSDENGIISKKKLIKSIKNAHTKSVIKYVYNALEDIIFDTLCSADKKQDVCIRLFEGISLDGKYVSEKTKKNNLTGQVSFVESKIKPKFNITRSYCDKLNDR